MRHARFLCHPISNFESPISQSEALPLEGAINRAARGMGFHAPLNCFADCHHETPAVKDQHCSGGFLKKSLPMTEKIPSSPQAPTTIIPVPCNTITLPRILKSIRRVPGALPQVVAGACRG
jgi:hypothetical protein